MSYKDIILNIYRDVKNEKDENSFPRILDYVNAVIKYKDKDFFKKNAKNQNIIDKKVEKIRRSVSRALGILVEDGILGKIGKYYVPIEQINAKNARAFLLENLLPKKNHLVQISKKVYVLPLRKRYLVQKKENKISTKTTGVWGDVERLKQENRNLKKKIRELEYYYQNKEDIQELVDKLTLFINDELSTSIFSIDYNIVIVIEKEEDKGREEIKGKLNVLIKDILQEEQRRKRTLQPAQKRKK